MATGNDLKQNIDPSLWRDAVELAQLMPQTMRSINNWADQDPMADLTLAQKRVMKTIFEGATTVSQVADSLNLTVSAATQTVRKLVDLNLIEQSVDKSDARNKPLHLTGEGLRMLEARRALQTSRTANVLSELTTDERKQILEAMKILSKAAKKRLGKQKSEQLFPSPQREEVI